MKSYIIKGKHSSDVYFMGYVPFIGSAQYGPKKDAKKFDTRSEANAQAVRLGDDPHEVEQIDSNIKS